MILVFYNINSKKFISLKVKFQIKEYFYKDKAFKYAYFACLKY